MHINIKETLGESSSEYDITGDYEEVLVLVTELGFCKPKYKSDFDFEKSLGEALVLRPMACTQ